MTVKGAKRTPAASTNPTVLSWRRFLPKGEFSPAPNFTGRMFLPTRRQKKATNNASSYALTSRSELLLGFCFCIHASRRLRALKRAGLQRCRTVIGASSPIAIVVTVYHQLAARKRLCRNGHPWTITEFRIGICHVPLRVERANIYGVSQM